MLPEYLLIGVVCFLLILCISLLQGFYSLAAKPLRLLAAVQKTDLIFPFVERGRARAAADQRRKFILGRIESDTVELLELPFSIEDSLARPSFRELERLEAAAQMATLKWQLNDDAYLLLGRVIDLITLICRSEKGDDRQLRTTVRQIKLRKATKRELGLNLADLFPFHIVLELENPAYWIERLRPYQDWLSIGLSVQKESINVAAFGRCSVGGGSEGKAGGYLRTGQANYQITCSHVLSNECISNVLRSPLSEETLQPDIAVLRANPCFESNFGGVRVVPIDNNSAYLFREKAFIRVPGKHRSGIFHEIVGWVTYQGRTHKFPHGQITPNINIVMDLFSWPPWATNFSSEGDSGSWVVGTNSAEWLGVLVAGDRRTHVSYVALSGPVMDFVIAGASLPTQSEPYREN